MNIRIFAGTIVLALLAVRANAGRLPVPEPADEASQRQSIRNQYSDQYASSNDRPSQIALARLLWQASLTAQTPAEGYAMLCEARDITARAEDLVTAFRIAGMMSDKYALTTNRARTAVFVSAADGIQGSAETDSYFKFLTAAIDQALMTDDFDSARRMIETGSATLSAQQADFWAEPLSIRSADLKNQQSAFSSLKPAVDRYRQDPTDPDANLVIGKYECLVKGDWKTGLPMLEHGSDEFLQKAASIELTEPKNLERERAEHWLTGKPQIKVADSWDSLEGIAPEYQAQLRLHVYDWYLRGLPFIPESEFETRSRVEDQLEKLLPVVDGHRANAPMFVSIAESLTHHTAKPTVIIGGALATESFQDAPETGGFLIGFHLGLAKLNGQQVITYLQPIYSTPDGDHEGAAFGKLFSKSQTVRAPAGYAIGAMKIAGDDGINSITFAFMRIDGNHLNPAERLNPLHIGGKGSAEAVIDSHGAPISGIVGKQKDGFLGLGAIYNLPAKKTAQAH
jgi:hypothetical protein